jgi:PAS domain-containing protein
MWWAAQRMRVSTGLALAVTAALVVFALSENAVGAALAFAGVAATTIAVVKLLARQQSSADAIALSGQRRRAVQWLRRETGTAHVLDSTIDVVSPQFERLLVMTAEQALDQEPWAPHVHALDRERVLREWRAWCADPFTGPFRCTYRMLTEDGGVVWVDEETIVVGDPAETPRWYERHLLEVVGTDTTRLTGALASTAPAWARAPRSLIVRCLRCGARYRRPIGHDAIAHSCPRCDYVGWKAAH